jgi:NADH-quinone oxidoreductase subunit E
VTTAISLSAEATRRIDEIVARYPTPRAAMLPVLWIVQGEQGWISPEAMEWIGDRLDCSAASVEAVVGFYTMFDAAPVGKYKLQVCRTLSCELMGARKLIDHLRERLGIEPGDTTDDGMFTLQEVECLGSCGTGPMLQCNFQYHENLSLERIDALLDELRGAEPTDEVTPVIHERPGRGAYREMFPTSGR